MVSFDGAKKWLMGAHELSQPCLATPKIGVKPGGRSYMGRIRLHCQLTKKENSALALTQ